MKRWKVAAGLVAMAFVACGGAGYVATQPAGEVPGVSARPMPASARFTVGGEPVVVHALPTGTIQIKSCHHGNCLSESAPYPLRFLSILADRTFVEPMPIWTYAIEHPEGVWVVDTGGDAEWMDEESWSCDPPSGRIAHSMARVDTREDEELVARLGAAGIDREKVRGAIITHMHFDHTAGVRPLGAKTYVGQSDVDAAQEIGATPCRFLDGARLEPVEPLVARAAPREDDFGDARLGASHALTSDGALRIYVTPGHTPGSLTVRLEADQGDLWFVGDTTFTQDGVREGEGTASIHTGMEKVRAQHGVFREVLKRGKAWLFPAHDDHAARRLVEAADPQSERS